MVRRLRLWILLGLCALLAACQPGRPVVAPPDTFALDLDRAERLIQQRELDGARTLLDTLTESHPEEPAPWRLLAGLHDVQQQPGRALVYFEAGLAAASPDSPGYPDLALQAALLAVDQPSLNRDPHAYLATLADDDPRRAIIEAALLLRFGNAVKVLRQLNGLLQLPPPPSTIGDIYYLAARAYRHLGEPTKVNDSLFHAVNFAQSPVLIYRIEKLWKSVP